MPSQTNDTATINEEDTEAPFWVKVQWWGYRTLLLLCDAAGLAAPVAGALLLLLVAVGSIGASAPTIVGPALMIVGGIKYIRDARGGA